MKQRFNPWSFHQSFRGATPTNYWDPQENVSAEELAALLPADVDATTDELNRVARYRDVAAAADRCTADWRVEFGDHASEEEAAQTAQDDLVHEVNRAVKELRARRGATDAA